VECPADNGFVNINITVPDFQVETTIRVGANPCLVMNGCPLTAEVRQGHQVSSLTLQAFGEIGLFHEVHLPTKIRLNLFAVYIMPWLLARAYFSSDELILL
jgi:hypothetical protein